MVNNRDELKRVIQLLKKDFVWRNGQELDKFNPYDTKFFKFLEGEQKILLDTNSIVKFETPTGKKSTIEWSVNVADVEDVENLYKQPDVIKVGNMSLEDKSWL
jgi:hypothetical protein